MGNSLEVQFTTEVLSVNVAEKLLTVKNLESCEIFAQKYDKLVLATGAKPSVPPIEGTDYFWSEV